MLCSYGFIISVVHKEHSPISSNHDDAHTIDRISYPWRQTSKQEGQYTVNLRLVANYSHGSV